MESLCTAALTSCVPAETHHKNLHDAEIEMQSAPVTLGKTLYLPTWRATLSLMLQSISWIPATNNIPEAPGSHSPNSEALFFFLFSDRTASWHAAAGSRQKQIIHLTWNIPVCVCVCVCVVGVRGGWHTCGMFSGSKRRAGCVRGLSWRVPCCSGHIVNSISHPINPAGGKTQHKIYDCLMNAGRGGGVADWTQPEWGVRVQWEWGVIRWEWVQLGEYGATGGGVDTRP